MFDPSSNYKNYRDRLDVIEPPLIPFQGTLIRPVLALFLPLSDGWMGLPGHMAAVFLADLTFIEEVPSHLKNGQVNFEKMHLIGKVISEVERYQVCSLLLYS